MYDELRAAVARGLHVENLWVIARRCSSLLQSDQLPNPAVAPAHPRAPFDDPRHRIPPRLTRDTNETRKRFLPKSLWAGTREFGVDAEHVMIHGVPVQFLPAHNELAESAVITARTLDYNDVSVRVIDPEHLVALALQAGGHKRRERAWQMLEAGAVNRQKLRTLLAAHGIETEVDDGP